MPRPLTAAVLLSLTAGCAACTAPVPAAALPGSCRSTAPRAAPARPGPGVRLPTSPGRIRAAAALARRFAVADSSWAARQPTAAWLAVLRPLTARPLYAVLARSAWAPAALAVRHRTRQAATVTVTAEQVRDLDAGSITLTVTLRQRLTGTAGTTSRELDLAVTVISSRGRLVVWDAEPAADGNAGEGGPADPAAP